MAIFTLLRSSFGVKILFSSVLTNLMVFTTPLEHLMPLVKRNMEENPVGYYSAPQTHQEPGASQDRSYTATPTLVTIAASETEPGEYRALQEYGVIGKSSDQQAENPSDNFFTIVLPAHADLTSTTIMLKYDLFGLASADQVTKSINGNSAYGGQLIVQNDNWIKVEEELPATQLHAGANEIFFNRRKDVSYQYQIKNLRITLAPKNSDAVRMSQKTLYLQNGKVQVSGTVSSPDIERLLVNGKTVSVNDGVFETIIDSVSDVDKVPVTFLEHNEQKTIWLRVKSGKQEYAFNFDGNDTDEAFKNFSLGEPAHYHSLKVSALSKEASTGNSIALKGKYFKDLNLLNADLANVTAGTYAGYLVKHTTRKDSLALQLHLAYDATKIPDGYTAADVRTFFYDKKQREWKALEVDSIDREKGEIISTSLENDTDYINGVLKLPESPEVGSFAPTMMTDMKYADPTAGIVGIAPPQPNSTGNASTSFPLKLPKGRNGMQPSLSLAYNSEGPNGLMGIGWSLSTPAIALNTKWGVPRFDPVKESEIYSLNGSDLVLKDNGEYTAPHRKADINRSSERIFYERKEGAFNKIVRHGSSPSNYYWEVTDKQGVKTFYGGVTGVDETSVIRIGEAGSSIAHWAIKRIQDPYGNYVDYTYTAGSATLSTHPEVIAKKFNLSTIKYTLSTAGSNSSYYTVEFKRGGYTLDSTTPAPTREDFVIDARNGYLSIINDYLTEVRIWLNENGTQKHIRGYKFDYNEIAFKKKQLSKISEYDASPGLFYSHTLEYYNDVQGQPIINSGTSVSWSADSDEIVSPFSSLGGDSLHPTGSPLGTSIATGVSMGLRGGFGFGYDYKSAGFTIGGSGDYSLNNQDTRISFLDINGDGLPDKVYRSGNTVFYRANTGSGFGELTTASSLNNIGRSKSRTFGGGIDLNLVYVGIGKSWSKTKTETSNYFLDYNGDGLADVVTDSQIKFNKKHFGNNELREFVIGAADTENPIISGPMSADLIQDLQLEGMDELREEHSQFDHVKVWRAPYKGVISIDSEAELESVNIYGSPNKLNTFTIRVEKGGADQMSDLTDDIITPQTLSVLHQLKPMDASGIAVDKGDLIFFRTHNDVYGYGGEVRWNPTITYSSFSPTSSNPAMPDITDETGMDIKSYDAQSDFMMNNNGTVSVYPGATLSFPSANFSNTFDVPSLPAGFKGNVRFYIKKTRQEISTGDETQVWTARRDYLEESGYQTPVMAIQSAGTAPSGFIDFYSFYVESDSNIKWDEINWQPKYAINDNVVRIAPVSYHTYDNFLIENSPFGDSGNNFSDNPYWVEASELPTPPTIIDSADGQTSFMRMSHDFPHNFPGILQNVDNSMYPLRASWTVKIQNTSGASIRHTRDFWMHKIPNPNNPNDFIYTLSKSESDPNQLIDTNVNNDIDTDYFSFDFSKQEIKDIKETNSRIFSAFYVSNDAIANTANNATIDLALVNPGDDLSFHTIRINKPYWVCDPQFYGFSYRGWGQFLYNGGLEFPRNQEGDILSSPAPQDYGNTNIDMGQFHFQNNPQFTNPSTQPENISGTYVVRYSFYTQDTANGTYKNDAIKHTDTAVARYGFNNGQLTAKLGRFGEPNLYPLYVDPAELTLGGSGIFAGMKQRAESKGSAVSGNIGGPSGSNSATKSKASSRILNQFLDMNGDRYPDIVTGGRIQYTGMLGGLSDLMQTNDFNCGDDSEDETLGITIPIAANSTKSDDGDSMGNKVLTNSSSGINDGNGRSYNARQYVDINGDGLPDKVRLVENKVKVRLNTGYAFTEEFDWGANANPDINTRESLGGGLSYSSSWALGFGASTGTADVKTMLVDLNGDGLPDLLNENGTYRLNTGKDLVTPASNQFYNDVYERDQSLSGNLFGTFTYGFTFTIVYIPVKVVFTISAGVNANFNEKIKTLADINGDGYVDVLTKGDNSNNSKVNAQLNRIGKTHLLKKFNHALGGSWTVDYTRDGNTYDMPQSKWVLSSIQTDDGFDGDVAYKPNTTLATATYESPKHSRREREFLGYGIVSVQEKDPSNSQTYRTRVSTYDNADVYMSGALKSTALYGQNGQLLSEQKTLYNLLNPDAPVVNFGAVPATHYLQTSLTPISTMNSLLDKSRLFVAPVRRTSTTYESGQSLTSKVEFLKYNSDGNLVEYKDYGTGPEDAYRTSIEYATAPIENAVSLPSKVVVYKDSDGTLLRQRQAVYNDKGKLDQFFTKLTGNDDSQMGFTYDGYGNVKQVKNLNNMDITNSNSFFTTITYDSTVNTYPVTVSNSYGESSSYVYNYLFGTNVLTTDSNDKKMRTRIDDRGRILEVTGPNEMAVEALNSSSSAFTIGMQYENEDFFTPGTSNQTTYMFNAIGSFNAIAPGAASVSKSHFAVTRHYDPEYPSNQANHLFTVSIVDGLGEPIQVKKTHKMTGSGPMMWMIGGREAKDAFGRTVKSYIPKAVTGYNATTTAKLISPDVDYYSSLNPASDWLDTTSYDERDRPTTITQSGASNSAHISYSIENGMFKQHVVNELSQTQDTYTDVRGRQRKTVQNGQITTSFDYNALNELMSVTDNGGFVTQYRYDFAGRKTEVRHPDRGMVTYTYDAASRLVKQATSNLLLAGPDRIEYKYNYGRLVETKYPQNPQNDVKYTYGQPGDAHATVMNAIGRVLYQEDATGVQALGYGNMGELTKQLRSVAVAGYQSYWFLTTWEYDSWNRVQKIIYPDEEKVEYIYNRGGNLQTIRSTLGTVTTDIVSMINYTEYGERSKIAYGNGNTADYVYESTSARRNLSKLTFDGIGSSNLYQVKSYTYDDLSNITGIVAVQPGNQAPGPTNIFWGGPINHAYEYDSYNRLVHASGNYLGQNDTPSTPPLLKQMYTLDMEYNSDHTIKKKTQRHTQGTVTNFSSTPTNVNPVFKNSYDIDYSGYGTGAFSAGDSGYSYVQPHAVRTIKESPSWVTSPAADDPRVHYKKISYDANGNQKEISETVGEKTFKLRNNLWDEENRLKAVDLKPDEKTMHPIAIYFYDATGERSVRYNLDRLDISSNGTEVGQAAANNIMMYPNGLLMAKVFKQDGDQIKRVITYTKHYYAGSERVGAKTGYYNNLGHYPAQTFLALYGMGTLPTSLIRPLSNATVTEAQGAISKIYTEFNLPQPSFSPIVEDVIQKYNLDPQGSFSYYFLSDHLGSSSYITNAAGNVSQHMEYLPFGETLVEEHLNSINSPFKYNGKAFDGETGNYYYGARYYDPKLSIWLSVDPLAEKYVGWSPYNYTLNNPINHTDPDGRSVDNEYNWDISTGKYTKISNRGGSKTDYVHAVLDGKTLWTTKEKVRRTTVNIRTNSEIASSQTMRLPGEIRTTNWKPTSGALHDPSAGIFASYAGGRLLGLAFGLAYEGLSGLWVAEAAAPAETTALANYFPSNGGALGEWGETTLSVGAKVDRYGAATGNYFSPAGTPIGMRALAPGNSGILNSYEVLKPFTVKSSTIAPAFGQSGLGTQYYSPFLNVSELVKGGYLKPM